MKPGVYEGLSMADYLRIPAVSASILQTMLDECPLAGWHASFLNAEPTSPEQEDESDDTEASDRGSIAHAILLEGSDACCCVVDPLDHKGPKGGIPRGWTTDAIKAARDNARAAGKIPILKPKMPPILAMVDVAHRFIESTKDYEPAFWRAFQPSGGQSELTLVWSDGGILCKIRPDRISSDRRLIVNYKTTKTSVEPERWGRTQFPDYYLGGSFYRRGIKALFGVEPDHVFLAQEVQAPFLCSLVGMDPATIALGDDKVRAALDLWQKSVMHKVWPGYAPRVVYPELPPWEINRWQEREIALVDERLMALGSQP